MFTFSPFILGGIVLGTKNDSSGTFCVVTSFLTIFLMFVKHTIPVFFFLTSHGSRFSLFSASNKCVELGSACKFQPLFHRYPI